VISEKVVLVGLIALGDSLMEGAAEGDGNWLGDAVPSDDEEELLLLLLLELLLEDSLDVEGEGVDETPPSKGLGEGVCEAVGDTVGACKIVGANVSLFEFLLEDLMLLELLLEDSLDVEGEGEDETPPSKGAGEGVCEAVGDMVGACIVGATVSLFEFLLEDLLLLELLLKDLGVLLPCVFLESLLEDSVFFFVAFALESLRPFDEEDETLPSIGDGEGEDKVVGERDLGALPTGFFFFPLNSARFLDEEDETLALEGDGEGEGEDKVALLTDVFFFPFNSARPLDDLEGNGEGEDAGGLAVPVEEDLGILLTCFLMLPLDETLSLEGDGEGEEKPVGDAEVLLTYFL